MAITPKPIKSNLSTLLILPGSYKILLQNQKTGGSMELFLPEKDFQISSRKFFPKKHPDFRGLETNQRHEIHALVHVN